MAIQHIYDFIQNRNASLFASLCNNPTFIARCHLIFVLTLFFDSAHVLLYLFVFFLLLLCLLFSLMCGVDAQLKMIYLDNPTIPLGQQDSSQWKGVHTYMHTDMETQVHTQTENITPHAETPTQRYLQRKEVRESLMQYTGGEGGFRMKPHQKQLDAIPALTCIRICVTMLNLCQSTRDKCGLLPVAASSQ